MYIHLRKHCPGMIVQFSTGDRELSVRGAMLGLKPDMAALATGAANFPTNIYENPPDFVEGLAKTMLDNDIKPEIEVFDLARIYNAAKLVKKIVDVCHRYGRRSATVADSREILGLRPA